MLRDAKLLAFCNMFSGLSIKGLLNPEVQKKFDKFRFEVNSYWRKTEQLATSKSYGGGQRWWFMWSLWSARGAERHITVAHHGKKGRARISLEASCHGQVGPTHQGLGASQRQPQARTVAMQSYRSSSSASDRAILHVTWQLHIGLCAVHTHSDQVQYTAMQPVLVYMQTRCLPTCISSCLACVICLTTRPRENTCQTPYPGHH